ncbi:MAG: ECF transporter S component [Clostridia bacterium]|nr:ECF transporter S component [Clostridia bacterium]
MKNISLKLFITTAAIAAIVFVLGLTPLGIIPLGFMNVTILCIPVIVGVLTLGLKSGLILGACFGLASTLRAFGIPTPASALVSNLMAKQPLLVILMSMLPRLAVPAVSFFAYRFSVRFTSQVKRFPALTKAADSLVFIIAFPALMIALYAFKLFPFWLTALMFVLFAAFEMLFASKSDNSSLILASCAGSLTNTVLYLGLMLLFYRMCGIDTQAVLNLIAGTGIIAGGTEAMAAAILTPPIIAALRRAHLSYI